jgi:hypothetical protein
METRFLYKYLPSKYADVVIKRGKLLFRNLSYFRQYEDRFRGDPIEGIHMDKPDKGFTITNVTQGFSITGNFSFLNSINQDRVFIFCLSNKYDIELYNEFSSDACIVIKDPHKFIARCRRAVKKLEIKGIADKKGLINRAVDYYQFNQAVERSIKDPLNLPFFKASQFSHQGEYRILFGYPGAFILKQRIIDNDKFDFAAEIRKGVPKERLLTIGSIEDIAEIRTNNQ